MTDAGFFRVSKLENMIFLFNQEFILRTLQIFNIGDIRSIHQYFFSLHRNFLCRQLSINI